MDVQKTTINAIRVLSAEAIETAKSGHPGLPLGCAPIAYALWQNFLKFNPKDAKWDNRDTNHPTLSLSLVLRASRVGT